MRWVLVGLLGSLLAAAPPLRIVGVERPGPPPYSGTERLYRLEGSGVGSLQPGGRLVLQRPTAAVKLGRLEVVRVKGDHALARLVEPGDTFPLKGDLAVPGAPLAALPELPEASPPPPGLPPEAHQPKPTVLHVPRTPGTGKALREPLFFLKGEKALSPGGQDRVAEWVMAWGVDGLWSLEVPQGLDLAEARVAAVREALLRQGVRSSVVREAPAAPPGRYDAVFLVKEPW